MSNIVVSARAKRLHNHYSYFLFRSLPFIEHLLYARYWYEQNTKASYPNITTQDVLGSLIELRAEMGNWKSV